MIHVEQCVFHELSDVPARQGVEGLVTVATHVDEASGSQLREVLGHARRIDEEMRGQLIDGVLAVQQGPHDSKPGVVGHQLECVNRQIELTLGRFDKYLRSHAGYPNTWRRLRWGWYSTNRHPCRESPNPDGSRLTGVEKRCDVERSIQGVRTASEVSVLEYSSIQLNRSTVRPREFKDGIFGQLARVGAAFSSPKRMEIIDLLSQGPRTVESIAATTSMSVANTSRHLGVLRTNGLVSSRREGLYGVYRLADESVAIGYQALRTLAESRLAEVRQLAEAFFGEVDGAEPVGIDELLARAEAGDVTVVDVRPRLEFEAGHLPGAISIPLDELTNRLVEIDRDHTVVAYCRGPYCVMSAQAVAQLREAGIDALRLAGGPLEWRASGLDIVSNTENESALSISSN